MTIGPLFDFHRQNSRYLRIESRIPFDAPSQKPSQHWQKTSPMPRLPSLHTRSSPWPHSRRFNRHRVCLFITGHQGCGDVAWGLSKLVGGLVFSLGLILCVLLGAELFTSTTLTLVAKAANRITWGQLLRAWWAGLLRQPHRRFIIVALIIMSPSTRRKMVNGASCPESGPAQTTTPSSGPRPRYSSATSWCVSPCGWLR